jgi:hypothetical protein
VTASRDYGEVVVSRVGGDRHRIDHADPCVLIAADLLMEATEGGLHYIKVSGEALDVVTIADDYGQKFIYRLGNYSAEHDAFEMEWPD